MRIEFHPAAAAEFEKLDGAVRTRIEKSLNKLAALDDPRTRLEPYTETLAGFWKLRVGDYRLICEIRPVGDGEFVLIIHVAHRSTAYDKRSVRQVLTRSIKD